MAMPKPTDTDSYIAGFPAPVQQQLQKLRAIIQKAAPQAKEVISYGMPAFAQHKVLVYFAGYKGHIGFYPTGSGIKQFEHELTGFAWSKGAVQFPISGQLPVSLITRMVKWRVQEDAALTPAKKLPTAKAAKGTPRSCPNGHQYMKSSDCPVCPECEKNKAGIIPGLSAPARRALEQGGLTTLRKIASQSSAQLLNLHGVGPTAIPKIQAALAKAGLTLQS